MVQCFLLMLGDVQSLLSYLPNYSRAEVAVRALFFLCHCECAVTHIVPNEK